MNYYLQDSVFIKTYNMSYILNSTFYKKDSIGSGTYCNAYKITKDKVIKFYDTENYLDDSKCFCNEVQNEIEFIKKFNNCNFITKSFIILEYNKKLIIIQEYAKIINVRFYDYFIFIKKINYFLDILKIHIYFYSKNYINLDIKSTNMGYVDNKLKLFDFNLIIEIDKYKKIDLLSSYKYYYLHPPTPSFPKYIISYSIAILILESFSTPSENQKYLYKPKDIINDKFSLLEFKKPCLGIKLFKILNECFECTKCLYSLLNDFESLKT